MRSVPRARSSTKTVSEKPRSRGDRLALRGRHRGAVEDDAERVAARPVGTEEDAEHVERGHAASVAALLASPPMPTTVPPRSSRPTTSAASTASRSTATSPSRSAARSRACSADLRGKPVARAAHRPRPRHAPDRAGARRPLPRRHAGRGRARAGRRDGRDRDALLPRRLARARRRADVHRLAQPEGLHGREARARGRAGAVGRRGDRRHPRARARRGCRRRTAAPGRVEEVDVARRSSRSARSRSSTRPRSGRSRSCSTAATAWRGRWSARSSSGSTASSWSRPTGSPTASSPTTSRTRCCPRTADVRDREGAQRGRRPRASPGTATPTAASSSTATATFVDGDFLDRAARALGARGASRRRDPLRRARLARRAGHGPRRRRHAARQPRRPRVLQDAHARARAAKFGGEVSGHYYFADFYNADSGTLPALLILELLGEDRARRSPSCSSRTARATSSPARSTPRSPTSRRRSTELRARYADAQITELDGISIDYDDWHFNVRPSNTEPLLRLCLESLVSPEHMAAKRDEVLALIRAELSRSRHAIELAQRAEVVARRAAGEAHHEVRHAGLAQRVRVVAAARRPRPLDRAPGRAPRRRSARRGSRTSRGTRRRCRTRARCPRGGRRA